MNTNIETHNQSNFNMTSHCYINLTTKFNKLLYMELIQCWNSTWADLYACQPWYIHTQAHSYIKVCTIGYTMHYTLLVCQICSSSAIAPCKAKRQHVIFGFIKALSMVPDLHAFMENCRKEFDIFYLNNHCLIDYTLDTSIDTL